VIRGRFVSSSEQDTRALAGRVARDVRPGMVLLLTGDLGAGKTAFVKGLAAGLGVDPDDVTSPTFTLVHQYAAARVPLVHVDLYRLDSADLDEIGLDADVAARGVTAVEWSERLTRGIPGAVRIRIADLGGDSRSIDITVDETRV
jgi:tRNA threonylcarbamoyladenosine biosynthesis protein TsaE